VCKKDWFARSFSKEIVMNVFRTFAALFAVLPVVVAAQTASQVELKVEPSNRTLTVSADGDVTVEPETAVLQIGFETDLMDAKAAYADGSRRSNAIISALKDAGIAESAIRSETQHLDRDYTKPHKFKLVQSWTVKAPAERAAEILDVAVTAGATSSGNIEWTVKDERALEDQALEKAAERAKAQAAVLAKGMGVHLGALIYVNNQMTASRFPGRPMAGFALAKSANAPQPLSIEPQKVSRSATVYAVFAIE
jgi:uncharacterized protein YggE